MAENRAAQLLAALARASLEDINTQGDIREVLDALVLAAARSGASRMEDLPADPPQTAETTPTDAPLQTETDTDDSCDIPAPEPGSNANAAGAASVWLKDDNSSHTIPGSPLSIGRAPALPNALDIGRALRPLRRFRPSRVHQRLDLDATVEHYTQTGILVPQLAPATEPWLEAVLVVDRGTSMAIWDETSLALTQMLRTLSAFRSIHVWHLEHPPQAEPVLRDHRGQLLPVDPSDLRHSQPAHRLLLVISDCAALAWRRSNLWQTLHTWGRTAPVALINPLPKRLWQRSGLDLPRTTATASVPASAGRLLSYRRPRLFRDDTPGTQPWQALPVLQMDAQHILAWARTVMRTDPSGCEAVLVPASGRVPPRNRSSRQSAAEPHAPATDAHVTAAAQAFTDNLHSPAVQLAIVASSLDVFTLPVLDVLRERLVPDAALADTAEFLTAGLLTATQHERADVVYRFHPAAAKHLRGLLSRDQAWDAHFALTDHLKAHPQAPHGIVAALRSPTSQEMLPTGLRPVAQAAAATARLLGVESIEPYSGPDTPAGLTTRSGEGEKDDAQQPPTPAVPDDSSEPAPDVEVAPDGPSFGEAVWLYPHQRDMLDLLNAERELYDRHRNLLVAPPGTGKTYMAAFDYQRLCEQHQQDLSLLFVAGSVAAVDQARPTYQIVLANPQFGEFLYGAGTLERGHHVFATWQSLNRVMAQLPPDHFDVIVIDDSPAIGTRMFANILERLAPKELLVLSAAPERANGPGIHEVFFESRIAAEMRLPDALASDLLSPVHYFGFADGTDLQGLAWKEGLYDRTSLNALLTADEARAGLVIRAVRDTVPDVRAMRAVGFCESLGHADFMTRCFRDAGIHAATLTAGDRLATRQETVSSLKNGNLQAIFCVHALGEDVHIPEVDTLLLLGPPSSTNRFLRQLSIGLPRFPGKPVLTVLDFIGHHRKEVRLDYQLRVMTNLTASQLLNYLEHGSPRLGDGFVITFDEKAKVLVTDSLREQVHARATGSTDERERSPAERQLSRGTGSPGRQLSAFTVPGGATAMASFTDGSPFLITYNRTDGITRMWNATTGRPVGEPFTLRMPRIVAIAIVQQRTSPPHIATINCMGEVQFWDSSNGESTRKRYRIHPADVLSMTGFIDGDAPPMLATTDYGGKIRLWNTEDGSPVGPTLKTGGFPGRALTSLVSPTGETFLATADYGGTVRLWEPRQLRPSRHRELLAIRPPQVIAMAGIYTRGQPSLLATIGYDDVIRIWDPFDTSVALRSDRARGHNRRTDAELWSYKEIAAYIRVQPDTVRSYRKHGLLPPPDQVEGGKPYWHADTVRAWVSSRPSRKTD